MKRHWAIRISLLLAVAGAAAAVPDDFTERMLFAGELHRQGDYARAESIFLAALREADRFGADDPRKAVVLNNLGSVYHSMNRYAQAEQCYRRAADLEERIWRASDDKPIRSILNLAALYIETGRFARAERLQLGLLAEQQPMSRRNHPDFARLLTMLGYLERRQGRHSNAQGYLQKALAIFETSPAHDSQTVETLNNLCVVYGESGRNTDALSFCERAVGIADRVRNPEPFLQASLLANVGTFQFLIHGAVDAEPFYRKALVIAEKLRGQQQAVVGDILLSYAALLERTGRKVRAKECRRQAQKILRAVSVADSGKYVVDLNDLLRNRPTH